MWEYVSLLAPAPHRMEGQLEKELMGKKMDRIPLVPGGVYRQLRIRGISGRWECI